MNFLTCYVVIDADDKRLNARLLRAEKATERAGERIAKAQERTAERTLKRKEQTADRAIRSTERTADRTTKIQERAAERQAKTTERATERAMKAAERASKKTTQRIERYFVALGRSVKRVFANMVRVVKRAARWIIVGVLAIGTACTKMAMNAEESENLFEVSMGNMANAARQWSEELSDALFLNEYEIRKVIATFNVMFDSMGIGTTEAYNMARGLTQLSYDMASFYNLKPEEAFQKLQAGITGEAEPLKRLGILINETTIKQYALNNAIWDGVGKMSEIEKVQARYGSILEQTAKAQGDMARTLDSSTNVFRSIWGITKELAIEIGRNLLPGVTAMAVGVRDWIAANKELAVLATIEKLKLLAVGMESLTGTVRVAPLYWKQLQITLLNFALGVYRVADAMTNLDTLFAWYRGDDKTLKKSADEISQIMDRLENETVLLAAAYVKGEKSVGDFFDTLIAGFDDAKILAQLGPLPTFDPYAADEAFMAAQAPDLPSKPEKIVERSAADRAAEAAEAAKANAIRGMYSDMGDAASDYHDKMVEYLDAETQAHREMGIEKGLIDAWYFEQHKQLLQETTDQYSEFTDKIKDWGKNARDLWSNLGDIATSALDSIAAATTEMMIRGKADWKALGSAVIEQLLAMIIKAQLLFFWQVLTGTVGMGGGGGGGGGSVVDIAGSSYGAPPGLDTGGTVAETGWAKVHKGETYSGVNGENNKPVIINVHPATGTEVEVDEYSQSDQRIVDVTMRAAGTDGAFRNSIKNIH